jgi:hypothetical protein
MAETTKDRFQSEFEALPLEEKIKTLLKFEATTLSETFNYAVNEPMKVVEKFGEVVADLGRKVEEEFKKASKSRECTTEPKPAASEPPPPKSGSAKGKPFGKKPKVG